MDVAAKVVSPPIHVTAASITCDECQGSGRRSWIEGEDRRFGDCEECDGQGRISASRAHDQAADRGEPCPVPMRQCAECIQSAREAGIPLTVIMGETKLSDHFTKEYITAQCGRKE